MKLAARALRYRPVHSVSSAPPSDEGAASTATHPSPSRAPPEWHPTHSLRRRAGDLGRAAAYTLSHASTSHHVWGGPFVTWVVDDGIVGDNNPSPLA
jgi:hypothetical protein